MFERGLNKSPKQVSTKSHMFLCMQDPHIFCARGHELLWAMLLIMMINEDDADDNYEGDDEDGGVLLVHIPKGRQCLISFPTLKI